ncbi:hypothetical protein CHRY9393_01363 [Chryseobacterium fistulae]|uniref:Uncharacterized protein n=1 Tax=Chryseobacterium fistulae TaxID=2675058 RepID=A0A6N4XQW8_9FLAO|nr:hypothetical protein CHRY9393_01363 [Chryseobacterium fistulae]
MLSYFALLQGHFFVLYLNEDFYIENNNMTVFFNFNYVVIIWGSF